MKFSQKQTKVYIFVSCIILMLTLAWLTVSLPFVYAAQQLVELNNSADANTPLADMEEETDDPFANSTEEKTSNSISSISEEYLHDPHLTEHYPGVLSKKYIVEHVSTYIAFYGELISPPPDAS